MSGLAISPEKEAQLLRLGESLDRLVTIDVTGRGVIDILYRAARLSQGGKPLSYLMTRTLVERVKPRDVVVISTCMPVGSLPYAEQDGPIGAATLARSLVLGLGAKPVIVTEERNLDLVARTLKSAGLYVLPLSDAREQATACAVLPFTLDSEAAQAEARRMLDDLRPAALIAIERAGANEHGVHHAARGHDLSAHNSKQDAMYELARLRGILTIGIGDGGNELGCGLIRDEIAAGLPEIARCKCPCGGLVVPSFVPDVLVTASVSNWGAYAGEAGIAAFTDRPYALHDRDLDLRVHTIAALAGANNDGPRLLDPGADAVHARYHGDLIELMALLVDGSADTGGLYRRDRWPWLYGV